MDITHHFKAGVMAAKLQRKGELDKNRILPTKKSLTATAQRDEFAKQAKEVCHKITTLRNVLLENRAAYMRIGQHLKSAAQMTDEQRDLIDRESEKFVTYYTQHLAQMRADWKRAKRKPQQREHMEAVLQLLESYLHNVQQIYVDQKKYRVQHELESYRLLKLAADKKQIPVRPAGEHSGKRLPRQASVSSSSEQEELGWSDCSDVDLDVDWQMPTKCKQRQAHSSATSKRSNAEAAEGVESLNASNTDAANANSDGRSQSHSSQQVALDEDIQKSQQLVDEEEAKAASELKPEDVQMFEQENVQLYHELQGLSEEVELIGKNVVDIAQLQDIFTEKVSLQQHNIERIANAVVGATENVKDANEQIKQAIQRNAGLRVWSLFFLLVMSFALLFLDWYYD